MPEDKNIYDLPEWLTEDGRPTITVTAGRENETTAAALQALYAVRAPIYQRSHNLVRVVDIKSLAMGGDGIVTPGVINLTMPILRQMLGDVAHWQRYSEQKAGKAKLVACAPPQALCALVLDMVGMWDFPILRGIAACPTIRPDGTLLTANGYDQKTGMVLRSSVQLPDNFHDHPSFDEADAAAALLCDLLSEFPFADEVARSVGLSMIMTAVLRTAMEVAPMHLVTAPMAGTGKSYLADVASVIATGERAPAIAIAPDDAAETEKRLVGSIIDGSPIICLDNCSEALAGDFLCQITERPLLRPRILGKSEKPVIANAATIFANGNNASVVDDLVRRTLVCTLDANTENPETRKFERNPLDEVRANRGLYVAACLIIARAYILAGSPSSDIAPLGSYEGWSRFVRQSLHWLGYADPVQSMAVAQSVDPVRQDRYELFTIWAEEVGTSKLWTALELVDFVSEKYDDDKLRHPKMFDLLLSTCGKRGAIGQIDPRRVGRFLTKHANTISAGLKMTVDLGDKRRIKYAVKWQ